MIAKHAYWREMTEPELEDTERQYGEFWCAK